MANTFRRLNGETTKLAVRLTPLHFLELEKKAKADDRTTSSYLRWLIKAFLCEGPETKNIPRRTGRLSRAGRRGKAAGDHASSVAGKDHPR